MAEGLEDSKASGRAPPLTSENILKVVKNAQNWRTLGEHIYAYTYYMYKQSTLDDIQHEHVSSEAYLRAIIEDCLSGKSRYTMTWRVVIWSLYKSSESQLAESIRSFAESDPTITVEKVIEVMKTVAVEKRKKVWSCKDIVPDPLLEEIYQNCSIEEERIHACADIYVNCHPDCSWTRLCEQLYLEHELTAVRMAKSFLPQTDPTLTVGNVLGVIENVVVDRRENVFASYPRLRMKFLECLPEEQRLHAFADSYVNCYPEASWIELCQRLYEDNEMIAARKAKVFIPQADPTWTVATLIKVMEMVTNDQAKDVWRFLLRSDVFTDISRKSSSGRELMYTYADIYVNCDPRSCWESVAYSLYQCNEMAAVEEVRPYLSPRDLTLTTEHLMELFADDESVDGLGVFLGTPSSKRQEFSINYKNPAQRKEAYLDYYVHNHPSPSWGEIAFLLRSRDLLEHAAMVERTYIRVSKRTRLNFEAAMKDGALWIRNGNTFFLGPGGSGKTHTLHILLEEDPPEIRESTACAKKPIRAVAQFKIGVSGTAYFVRLTDNQYSDMLANSAEHSSVIPKNVAPTEASQPPGTSIAVTLPSSSTVKVPESPSTSDSSGIAEVAAKETNFQNQLPVGKLAFERELLHRMQARSKTVEKLGDQDLMDVRDSGGQPMFHEVLPAFVTNTMFGILTVKLNESLHTYPLIEYYIRGNQIGEPFKSPFTHLQTFRHCLRVLQSTCKPTICPKIIFVGTHKDLEHECQHEDRKEKDRQLQSIIPPEMKDNIIYNGESLLFPINAKTPGNNDRKIMGNLRLMMIKELRKLPKKKIPLRYFSLEIAFQRLARDQQRAILSIDECLNEAKPYQFTSESLDDVLQYLHSLKLIIYYKDILPNVVFINAQVLLDKITELVEYSIELRVKPSSLTMAAGSLEKFKTCGIVTTKIMSQFNSGYVPGLFEEQHLILLFKKLLIVSEIGEGKFLMPSLLEEEKVQILSDSIIPALLFYFGPNGPKFGVYCFLLASLITEARWELLMEDNSPVQLSRNRAQFVIPGNHPGCVTITDSFSTFLHINIEFPDGITEEKALEICEIVCPTIRETILTHIRKASHRLNYDNSVPEAAFLCCAKHDETTTPHHPAIIPKHKTGLLTCSICPKSVFSTMTEKHELWLGMNTSDPELSINDLCMVQRYAWEARSKWYNMGLELGIDPGTLDTISKDHVKSDDQFRVMLTTWLKKVEPKPSWEALAEALRSPTIGCEFLAEKCMMPPTKKVRLS